MDTFYTASVHHFFNKEDSNPTYRCFSHSIKRMRFCILYTILQVAVVATDSSLTPELYWKSMLPTTTPMPKSIADLLHPPGDGAIVRGVTESNIMTPNGGFKLIYGGPRHGHFKTKLQDNPNTTLFFLEKDLTIGHKMKFLFTQSSNKASFLPRQVVKFIPFSSTKMAQILNKFAVKPRSIEAEVMENTIKECEESGIKGEEKYCATSLESMVDLTILKLGKDVEALSTEVMNETKKQEYTITHGVEKVGETKVVVCHKLNYVYAVFYCHKIDNTVAYTVSLEGTDGSRVKAVSVCHRNTSQWSPKHLAFQMLKVKPGSVPICHFLFQDSIAWVPKQK